MKIVVEIDREKCIGCGVAPAICPEVFHLDEDGKNSVVEAYRVGGDPSKGEIPYSEALEDCVKKAAESCPVAAISVKVLKEKD